MDSCKTHMICEDLKKIYSNVDISEIEKASAYYTERLIEKIDMTKSIQKPGFELERYMLLIIYSTFQRSKSLFYSFINNINSKDVVAAYLLVRAHMETTGAIAYFFKKLNQYLVKEIDKKNFKNELVRQYLGRRFYENNREYDIKPQPINVLTQIDAAEHYLKKYLDVENGFRKQ